MTDTLYRYPGAQPFRDDELARQTFFGRDSAAVALTDQILANRLVVVYAKSGVGKTSLLNAGVASRLREAGTIPLFVRVNDVERNLLASLLDGIRAEAVRQKVEYVAGDSASLWSFFKTVQFWRGDLLLTPALILDQFEELFTLQSEDARDSFLSELSYVVRGVPPPSLPATDTSLSGAPPSLHIVLSLREDFLGLLEEASDRITQILDHRFRLAPLDRDTAADAITRPAEISDPSFATKPFRLHPDLVPSILNYLTRSAAGGHRTASRYIEPFHLQLICQRIERIVAAKQRLSSEEVQFTLKDLGGEQALAETLAGFYEDAIRSLPTRRLRGAARRLCEQYLISPEGRRLSLEERELRIQLKLPHEALRQLVDRRLLRTDRRAESTYYELSHDSLVQPVLATRRTQALVVGWVAVVAGGIVSVAMGALVLVVLLYLAFGKTDVSQFFGGVVIVFAGAALGSFSVRWLRAGIRTRRRYRRRASSELSQELPTLLPLKDKVLGWTSLVTGSVIGALFSIGGVLELTYCGARSLNHGQLPRWLSWLGEDSSWQVIHDHPFVELSWGIGELVTIVAFGWILVRLGMSMLWPHIVSLRSKASLAPGLDKPPSPPAILAKLLVGTFAFILSALGTLTLRQCVSTYQGKLPHWLPQSIIGSDISESCQTLYNRGSDFTVASVALFLIAAFVFAIIFLHSGVAEGRSALRYRRMQQLMRSSSKAAATQRVL